MRRRKPHLLSLLIAALALLVGACGEASPRDLLDGAPDRLEDAETSRFEMEITAAGEGVDSGYSATGEQDLVSATLQMDADLGVEGTTTQTRVVDDVVYMASPLFEMFTGREDAWVRLDLEEAGEAAGLDTEALVHGNTGPAALIQQLRGAADEIEELGDDEVRGVDTRQLRVMVDTDRAIEQSPPEVREQLRTFAEASGLPTTYPMEVWVDDDGLPRRLRTVVEVQDEVAGAVTQQTTLELFDFGAPVDVEVPDEDDIVELQQLLEDLAVLEEGLDEDGGAGLDDLGEQ